MFKPVNLFCHFLDIVIYYGGISGGQAELVRVPMGNVEVGIHCFLKYFVDSHLYPE